MAILSAPLDPPRLEHDASTIVVLADVRPMLGWIACGYNPATALMSLCNQEVVAFDAPSRQNCRRDLLAHAELTGSRPAAARLQRWAEAARRFLNVTPLAAASAAASPALDAFETRGPLAASA